MKPVLVLGISFKAFYALVFFTVALFMGTLNIIILVLGIIMYIVIRTMTKIDSSFFAILRRSWRYQNSID